MALSSPTSSNIKGESYRNLISDEENVTFGITHKDGNVVQNKFNKMGDKTTKIPFKPSNQEVSSDEETNSDDLHAKEDNLITTASHIQGNTTNTKLYHI